MAILGDDQAADLRRQMLEQGALTGVEAFPQKDDPRRRVFPEAKLSTAIFTLVKSSDQAAKNTPFQSRIHAANMIDSSSPSLLLRTSDIPLYDALNLSIVSCAQEDWDLAVRIVRSGRMSRLREYAEFSQGEVNETNERSKGNLAGSSEKGDMVVRGANICLYTLRAASQGNEILLDVERYLAGRGEDTKAFHHRHRRIGLQESCPQNNFRRIVAALVPEGHFCNHKVNYLPEHKSRLPLEFVLGLLNSKLADWYFRLGSSNNAVSHYQLYNLPCPVFSTGRRRAHKRDLDAAVIALESADTNKAFQVVGPMLKQSPFSAAIQDVIIECVKRIIAIEERRDINSRSERSALHPDAQIYQDLIDRLLYAMAGLSEAEARGLEERLKEML